MNDDFILIHDEFHRCVEILIKIKNYNKDLKKRIQEVLNDNESLCLDSKTDSETLLDKLVEKLDLDKILTY